MSGKCFPYKKSKTGIAGSNIKEEKKLGGILFTYDFKSVLYCFSK